MRQEELQQAIGAAVDEQRLRMQALDLAIKAIRKMQYGRPGIDSSIELADAFYKFLKGEKRETV